MAITKTTEVGQIEIVGSLKNVQVRTDTVIKEDGAELSRNYNRHVLHCGYQLDESDNLIVTDISGEDSEVKAICNVVWTQAVKDAWKDLLISRKT
tara:strand:+ start:560 stop:844 length:285 start_codon:yes stop_codon:yes gene_type:complete